MLPGHTPGGEGSRTCLLVQQACYMGICVYQVNCGMLKDLPTCPWPHSPSMEEVEEETSAWDIGTDMENSGQGEEDSGC